MRKRRIPLLLSLSTLLGVNLLTTNLLCTLPALADGDAKDQSQNQASAPVNTGLSGQTVTPYVNTLQMYNGLPVTTLDSFVYQAGAQADQIYGDESVNGLPEFADGFTSTHRINAGITGARDAGLTTGHGSMMPSAWGRDEFIASPGEWAMTGPGGYSIDAGQEGGIVDGNIMAPGALGSTGTAGGTGLGRVIGMPNSAGYAMPGIAGLPGLPSLPSLSGLPGLSSLPGMGSLSSLPSLPSLPGL
jgi:hypothetical protein